jgi:hypothetical protein
MRKLILTMVVALGACSADDGPASYDPQVSDLAPAMYAGATVALALDPLPALSDPLTIRIGGDSVEWMPTESGATFTLPDTASGATVVELALDGEVVWADTVAVAGFREGREATAYVGHWFWNLITMDLAGETYVWGAVAEGKLGRLRPSTGVVTTFDDMLESPVLRVPGPTPVSGQWIVAPPSAVAVDSFEIWQLAPFPSKIRRIPRKSAGRQLALLSSTTRLVTNHHNSWTVNDSTGAIITPSESYEEPQVIFRSPRGDRFTISFHGSYLGTPVFRPDGQVAYHIQGMRGVHGVAFSPDSARMVLVGYGQDYSNLLMEVALSDGARIDSITLGVAPRAVAFHPDGRLYVLSAGKEGRPAIDVYARPGFAPLGRMQAPASARACAYFCMDGVIGFDHFTGQLLVVDAADPSYVGGTGNGIWAFDALPPGAP